MKLERKLPGEFEAIREEEEKMCRASQFKSTSPILLLYWRRKDKKRKIIDRPSRHWL